MATPYFSPATFRFLAELGANNERAWFEANKQRYLDEGRAPMLRFITDLAPKFAKISKQFEVDPKPVGGSMMRIYRDVRFSRDKSPYKNSLAAHFSHRDGGEEMGVGYYLHLEPGRSMLGGGVWRPGPAPLQKIREAIVADPKGWTAATSAKVLGKDASLHGETLKRPPRGFDPEHPLIADLKRKDFGLGIMLKDKALCGPGALDLVVDGYKSMTPFIRFLCRAVGAEF